VHYSSAWQDSKGWLSKEKQAYIRRVWDVRKGQEHTKTSVLLGVCTAACVPSVRLCVSPLLTCASHLLRLLLPVGWLEAPGRCC
jgi:hypothetical protein